MLFFFASFVVAEEKEQIDYDLERIWGVERDVSVIQKRVFEKDGRFEFSVNSGIVPNDEFFLYFPIGARVDYFFTEDIGIELAGAYIFSMNSDLKGFLDKQKFFSSVELPQKLQFYGGLNGVWNPIHGKISVLGEKLSHFDMALYFGAGMIGTKVYKGHVEKNKYSVYGNVGAGLRFYLSDSSALRLDYRHFFYPAEGGGVSFPAEITLGFSLFTSAPK